MKGIFGIKYIHQIKIQELFKFLSTYVDIVIDSKDGYIKLKLITPSKSNIYLSFDNNNILVSSSNTDLKFIVIDQPIVDIAKAIAVIVKESLSDQNIEDLVEESNGWLDIFKYFKMVKVVQKINWD